MVGMRSGPKCRSSLSAGHLVSFACPRSFFERVLVPEAGCVPPYTACVQDSQLVIGIPVFRRQIPIRCAFRWYPSM